MLFIDTLPLVMVLFSNHIIYEICVFGKGYSAPSLYFVGLMYPRLCPLADGIECRRGGDGGLDVPRSGAGYCHQAFKPHVCLLPPSADNVGRKRPPLPATVGLDEGDDTYIQTRIHYCLLILYSKARFETNC